MTRPFLALATIVLGALAAGCDNSVNLIALTETGHLIQFSTSKPTDINTDVTVSGLPTNTSLVQIAYRPASGVLYGLTSGNELVTLDPSSGGATLVGDGVAFTSAVLASAEASWNPVTDLLRIVSGSNNITVDATGDLTSTDTPVAFAAGDTNAGKAPQIAAMAYDNGLSGTSSSNLFALDVTTQSVVIVGGGSSPDTSAGGVLNTVGSLGTSFGAQSGFAIQASTNSAYATLAPTGLGANLFTVDLTSGAASLVNPVGDGTEVIISLASPP